MLSAGTTAVGLGSHSISQVVPVRLFGIYSAAGVLVSLPILFLLLTSLLELWPVRPVLASARHSDRRRRWLASPGMETWGQRFVRTPVRKHAAVSLAFAAAMVIALVGLARLETSVNFIDMFSPRARIIQDYAWLEPHLGPLVPIELAVLFDEAATLSVSVRVEAFNDLDYGRFLRDLRAKTQPIVDRWPGLDPSHVDVTYTRVVPLVYKTQRTLMSDLTSSFFGAWISAEPGLAAVEA